MSTLFSALIPVKPLSAAKSRLRDTLGAEARARLAFDMFERTLNAVRASALIGDVYVTTADPRIAAHAAAAGAAIIPDAEDGLNAALETAVASLLLGGARAIVIVQGDLPWLDASALDAFLVQIPPGGAGIAPDQHGRGTSALGWRDTTGLKRFCFGADSFEAHLALLHETGLEARALAPSTAFRDVDDASDLAAYLRDFRPVLEPSP